MRHSNKQESQEGTVFQVADSHVLELEDAISGFSLPFLALRASHLPGCSVNAALVKRTRCDASIWLD